MQYGVFEDSGFQPVGLIRVDTENSIWFVGADRYQRLPREERPRPQRFSIEGRLADARWHRLRRCWWRVHADGERPLRLLPDVRPARRSRHRLRRHRWGERQVDPGRDGYGFDQ